MHIGDMRIDTLIDGESSWPKEYLYKPDRPPSEEDWAPYADKYLDHCEDGHSVFSIGSYLIRHDDNVVLYDAGVGPQSSSAYSCGGLRSSLWSVGVSPEDVTDVVYSHLHMDHIGWTSINGKPFFPNATIRIDRRDWEHYSPDDYEMEEWEKTVTDVSRDLVSVRFAPVLDRIELFEGDEELLPGIAAMEASGHTPGHTVIELTSNGEKGLLIGDLVHTVPELLEQWEFLTHFDHDRANEAVERFRKYLFDTKTPFAGAHFTGLPWGRLESAGNGKLSFEVL